jgi:hypothetical protein
MDAVDAFDGLLRQEAREAVSDGMAADIFAYPQIGDVPPGQ